LTDNHQIPIHDYRFTTHIYIAIDKIIVQSRFERIVLQVILDFVQLPFIKFLAIFKRLVEFICNICPRVGLNVNRIDCNEL